MTPSQPDRDGRAAARLSVRGVVQGVGFRPFVYSLAQRHTVTGWVRNTSAGVEILAEGTPADVDAFVLALPREAPPRSHIAAIERTGAAPEGASAFLILGSAIDPDAYQLVSPDIATCDDCRAELLEARDRRYGYPFTNCTNCGPRFTIIEDIPYDRPKTTMRDFSMCPQCQAEY
ncbi:MAG: acylphosphatase, partial [Actinobacteria bacterium]|nr:acylphosphatase [Actinomycetota bacterium]